MVVAAIAAVICANSDAYEAIHHILMEPIHVGIGSHTMAISIEVFVNDFLMAIFFLLVGIELKYEMTVGELRRPRQALLPMLAAVGGVVVPATIYMLLNRGSVRHRLGYSHGNGHRVRSRRALAVGQPRARRRARVLLDPRYCRRSHLHRGDRPVLRSGSRSHVAPSRRCGDVSLFMLNKTQHYRLAPYMVGGFVLWVCLFKSGVHATLAGVIVAFAIPARSGIRLDNLTDWLRGYMPDLVDSYDEDAHILGQHDFTHATLGAERVMHRVSPPLVRLERKISTPVNFIILPLFAFVNAQVRLVGVDVVQLAFDPVSMVRTLACCWASPSALWG